MATRAVDDKMPFLEHLGELRTRSSPRCSMNGILSVTDAMLGYQASTK